MVVNMLYAFENSTMHLLSAYGHLPGKIGMPQGQLNQAMSALQYQYILSVGLNFFDFKFNLAFQGPLYILSTVFC